MGTPFECVREIVLTVGQQDAWNAVATVAGHTAWLFPGDVPVDGEGAAVWNPPHAFVARQEMGDWYNALGFHLSPGDGDSTILRYTHAGIFLDGPPEMQDAVQQHTDFYLDTLVQYLTYFNGVASAYVGNDPGGLQAPMSSVTTDGFERAKAAMGIPATATAGDEMHITASGLESFRATVGYSSKNFLSLRSSDALYCFFGRNAFGAPVGMSIHIFGDDAADAVEPMTVNWQAWLNATFAADGA